MKKIIILMVLSVLTLPTLAACPITGAACSASMLRSTPLNEKYVPDNIKNIQKPDAFTPKYVTPYENMLINTESASKSPTNETPGYNSNCQFGVCLPGANPSNGTIFD